MNVARVHLRQAVPRGAVALAVGVSILALSALSAGPAAAGTSTALRAVIVVGPASGSTGTFITKANAIAAAAADHGMEVVKVYHPNATWARVVAAANGANLLVYLGHGNGWPSPYGPFQEDTKDGLGLNPFLNSTNPYTTKYYGANRVRESIRLAPNAIVLLNKLCYAEGNAEPGMALPTTAVARQRVDNYAAGFLAVGARAVFAFGWQPGENLVNSLFSTTPRTMDAIFMTRFGANRDGSYKPYFGWIGWKPDLYFDSVRSPGFRNHLDPDPAEGYLRAVTGDLGMTTDQWSGNVEPADQDPPDIRDLSGLQASDTVVPAPGGAPVFTPNGDGLSDTMTLRHTLSERAILSVDIRRADGTSVRRFSVRRGPGTGTTIWDGKNAAGRVVRQGPYEVIVTPRDRAGNVGAAVHTSVLVLTAMKAPTVSPAIFDPTDGDDLAQTTSFGVTLSRGASLTWRVFRPGGELVRRVVQDQLPSGSAAWQWDGLDDEGIAVPHGLYSVMITVRTEAGRYAHRREVRLMPFRLWADRTVGPGQQQTIKVATAEAVSGSPRIEVRQPGRPVYLLPVTRRTGRTFTAPWTLQAGANGPISITVTTTDVDGGVQSRRYLGRLSGS